MAWKRFSDEGALNLLCQIEVVLLGGSDIASACRKVGQRRDLLHIAEEVSRHRQVSALRDEGSRERKHAAEEDCRRPRPCQHLKGLQDRAETLKRQIAFIDQERSLPVERISDETVESFGKAVKTALRDPDNSAFARAYVETIISEVVITEKQVRIKGPNAALMQQIAAFAARGELVPSFAQEWRAISDKSANWRMALSY